MSKLAILVKTPSWPNPTDCTLYQYVLRNHIVNKERDFDRFLLFDGVKQMIVELKTGVGVSEE